MDQDMMEMLQWAQTPEAQPFLQEMEITPEMIMELMGGGQQPTGAAPSMDMRGYGDYLNEWAMSQPNNPEVGRYVTQALMEMENPYNQFQMQQDMQGDQRSQDINAALEFLALGEEGLAQEFLAPYRQSGYGVGGGDDMLMRGLRTSYEDRAKEGGRPQDVALYSLLSQPTPEVAQTYYDEPGWWDRTTAPWRHGTQTQSMWKKNLWNLLFPGLGEVVQPVNQQRYAEEEVRDRFLSSGYGGY